MSARSRDRKWHVALGVLGACAAGCTAPGTVAPASQALAAGPELVVLATTWQAPPGGDGEAQLSVAWRETNGRTSPIEVGAPIVQAVPFGRGAAVRTATGQLLAAYPDGSSDWLAGQVIGELGTSDDGVLLVWARAGQDGLGDLHVTDGRADRVVATALQSAGLFRFSSDRSVLAFVGSEPGGVAGVFAVGIEPASPPVRLTNVGLRAGRPWNGAFEPPPRRGADLDVDALIGRVR